jgi:hypothetical protein
MAQQDGISESLRDMVDDDDAREFLLPEMIQEIQADEAEIRRLEEELTEMHKKSMDLHNEIILKKDNISQSLMKMLNARGDQRDDVVDKQKDNQTILLLSSSSSSIGSSFSTSRSSLPTTTTTTTSSSSSLLLPPPPPPPISQQSTLLVLSTLMTNKDNVQDADDDHQEGENDDDDDDDNEDDDQDADDEHQEGENDDDDDDNEDDDQAHLDQEEQQHNNNNDDQNTKTSKLFEKLVEKSEKCDETRIYENRVTTMILKAPITHHQADQLCDPADSVGNKPKLEKINHFISTSAASFRAVMLKFLSNNINIITGDDGDINADCCFAPTNKTPGGKIITRLSLSLYGTGPKLLKYQCCQVLARSFLSFPISLEYLLSCRKNSRKKRETEEHATFVKKCSMSACLNPWHQTIDCKFYIHTHIYRHIRHIRHRHIINNIFLSLFFIHSDGDEKKD